MDATPLRFSLFLAKSRQPLAAVSSFLSHSRYFSLFLAISRSQIPPCVRGPGLVPWDFEQGFGLFDCSRFEVGLFEHLEDAVESIAKLGVVPGIDGPARAGVEA